MDDLITYNEIQIYSKDGKAWTDSLEVAKWFEKEHRNVLRDIENLECSIDFRVLNFEQSEYQNIQNKSLPKYDMTRDGFMFLCMGFTGAKAAKIKEQFIYAFNAMEHQLINGSDRIARVLEVLTEMQKDQIAVTNLHSISIKAVDTKVNIMQEDVNQVKCDIIDIKDRLPDKRLIVSKKDKQIHISFIRYEYHGYCPVTNIYIVNKYGIITENNKPIAEFDHMYNKGENGIDKVWLINRFANQGKRTGEYNALDIQRIFDGYQTKFKWYRDNIYKQPLFTECGN
jgi:Rha family phage regulatory protein